jgi:hypothetical protein
MEHRPSARRVAEIRLSPDSKEAIRYLANNFAQELTAQAKFRAFVEQSEEVKSSHVEHVYSNLFTEVVIPRNRDRWHYGELLCTAIATTAVTYLLTGFASAKWDQVVFAIAVLCFAIWGFMELDRRCVQSIVERSSRNEARNS